MEARVERDDELRYVLADVPVALRDATLKLAFAERDGRFERTFALDSRYADVAAARFPRIAEELVLQAAGVRPTPWDAALEEVVRRADGSGLRWWIGGSVALAVRGLDVAPRDVDLIAEDDDAVPLAELLVDALVEPLVAVDGWICRWWTRAFVAGARVEWIGGPRPEADEPEPADFGLAGAARLETVRWRSHEVRVPPLELQLAVCERRGLHDRAALIRAAID
jgi:hypothetical protein